MGRFGRGCNLKSVKNFIKNRPNSNFFTASALFTFFEQDNHDRKRQDRHDKKDVGNTMRTLARYETLWAAAGTPYRLIILG